MASALQEPPCRKRTAQTARCKELRLPPLPPPPKIPPPPPLQCFYFSLLSSTIETEPETFSYCNGEPRTCDSMSPARERINRSPPLRDCIYSNKTYWILDVRVLAVFSTTDESFKTFYSPRHETSTAASGKTQVPCWWKKRWEDDAGYDYVVAWQQVLRFLTILSSVNQIVLNCNKKGFTFALVLDNHVCNVRSINSLA